MALELLVVLLLILVNGLFAMAELAVVASRRARLKHAADGGSHGARAALRLAEDPSRFLSTVQVGITLMGVLAGAFGGATISRNLEGWLAGFPALAPYAGAMAIGLVVVGITYLSLILGELVPKRLALSRPEAIAAAVAPAMRLLSRLASPVVALLGASGDLVLRLLPFARSSEPQVTDEEVKLLMQQGLDAGLFLPEEKAIVDMTLRLGDRTVGALMTPRTRVEWLDPTDPPEELRRKIVKSHFSRFPAIEGDIHRVLGVVDAKDLLAQAFAGQPFDLRQAVRPALFIPENAPALRAVETFRRTGSPIACVVDEYGDFQGLVTLHDVLEALVGDLARPGEADEPAITRREDGSWLVDGLLPFDALKDAVELPRLPAEDPGGYHTVAGFVLARLRRIPKAGDGFDFGRFRFEVVDMDGRRIDKVLVTERGPAVLDP